MITKEKPIYLKEGINLSEFLKTDFGSKVKEVHNCLEKLVMKNPYEYLKTGVVEEALVLFKYYLKCQKPQLQEDCRQQQM